MKRLRPYRMFLAACVIFGAVWRYQMLSWRRRFRVFKPTRASYDRAHKKTGGAIYWLAQHLGGGFVKVGQVLGSRKDVFPDSFLGPLRQLHDRVPARPFSKLEEHVVRELGQPLDEVFRSIEAEALAAASLAQVHKATLLSGEEVAVKIQYPEAQRIFPVDLRSLRFATRIIRRINPALDLRALAKELTQFVTLELDFSREGASTDRIRGALEASGAPAVSVPEVHHASERLLVLEFLPGVSCSRLSTDNMPEEARRRLADAIAGLYVWMIFEVGFFHGDPHPGNILVTEEGSLSLLDFGLARELPSGFTDGVAKMIAATMQRDDAQVVAAAQEIGFRVEGQAPEEFAKLVRMLLGQRGEGRALDALNAAGIQDVPPHFALIARVFVLLNGLSHQLVPGEPVIVQAIAKALLPRLSASQRRDPGLATPAGVA